MHVCACVCMCVHVCACVCMCVHARVDLSMLEYINMLKEMSLACVLLPFRRFYCIEVALAAGCFNISYIQHGSVQLK